VTICILKCPNLHLYPQVLIYIIPFHRIQKDPAIVLGNDELYEEVQQKNLDVHPPNIAIPLHTGHATGEASISTPVVTFLFPNNDQHKQCKNPILDQM
jgi:hypothetical protein